MAPPNNNTPSLDDALAAIHSLYSAANPQTTQAPVQEPEGPGMFMNTPYGSMMMPSGSYVSQDDLHKVQSMLPQLSAGPYATNPTGEGVTASKFGELYNSPFVTDLGRAVGGKHPLLGRMFDNALMAPALTKAPVDAAGRPIATGAGFGISSVAGAMQALPEARLAQRQQLEEVPLGYESEQAKLEEERAKQLQGLATTAYMLGRNPAQIAAWLNRGLGAENVRAGEAGQANSLTNAVKVLESFLKANTSIKNTNTRAKATTDAAKTRGDATVTAANARANKPGANSKQLLNDAQPLIKKATSAAEVTKLLQSGTNPYTMEPLPPNIAAQFKGFAGIANAQAYGSRIAGKIAKIASGWKNNPQMPFGNVLRNWDEWRGNAAPAAAPAATPSANNPLGLDLSQ